MTKSGIILITLILLLCGCNDDNDYHYPSVKLEFLTATSDAKGRLTEVVTDKGMRYQVLVDGSKLKLPGDTLLRIVTNYEEITQDGESGVQLYGALIPISNVPIAADEFKEGILTDAADVQSIWMGLDYLNMMLQVKAQDAKHTFAFVEEEVMTDEAGKHKVVHLSLYHDADDDLQAYTQRAYASIPLRHYATEGIEQVTIHFSLQTYSGRKTYEFEYIPKEQ